MIGARAATVFSAFLCGIAAGASGQEASPPPADYWVYVANESSDLVSRVRFGPDGAVEEKTIEVGYHPADIDGPHGITVSPTGDHWYVSIAHGTPFGQIWKFETGTDRFVDSITVGLFPATMAVTPDGAGLFVVNFNLHGDPVPSSVSAVFTPLFGEITKIETCVTPHGGHVIADGTRHFSGCVASDQLVEISTTDLAVTRRIRMTRGREGLVGAEARADRVMGGEACRPTWVTSTPASDRLYVPCNARREVLELDAETLAVTRRFPTGAGPYNATVSPDGQILVVTLKGDQAVALLDLETGHETRVETSRSVTHGVVVTPDSRYAFVSNEAVGATRGTVDVIDLRAARVVATVEVQYQPGGIGFWKMEPR